MAYDRRSGKSASNSTQNKVEAQNFAEAARALECDESEERFDAALKKVAAHKPPKQQKDEKKEGK